MKVTFWGNNAENFTSKPGTKLEIKNGSVKKYNGLYSISMTAAASFKII